MLYANQFVNMSKGKAAELMFVDVISRLGIFEIKSNKAIPTKKPMALVKTPEEVDYTEGIDFYLYHPGLGWINIDITLDMSGIRWDKKTLNKSGRRIRYTFSA